VVETDYREDSAAFEYGPETWLGFECDGSSVQIEVVVDVS
jgi:hypothetical protein